MKHGARSSAYIILASLLISACSFDYGTELAEDGSIPEMTMTGVTATRYENARLSVELRASVLEMYDTDKIWAASDVQFIQYMNDGSGNIEAEGSAGLFLVNDESEIYSLGETASFRIIEDDLFLTASDLRWDRTTHTLASGRTAPVELDRGDGSSIIGTGFSANTLSREYQFAGLVSGILQTSATDAEEPSP